MLISVIIPYYNNSLFIHEAVKSLIQQTYKQFEVIMVNNNSTDNSEVIARKAAGNDSRFKWVFEKKRGVSAALNTGVQYIKGDYVSFLDADDIYHRSRLMVMAEYIESHNIDILACNGNMINEKGHLLNKRSPYIITQSNIAFELMLHNIVVSMSFMLIRKDILITMIPFPDQYSSLLDYYLLIQCISLGYNIGLFNEFLVKKRIHCSNLSHNFGVTEKQAFPLLIQYIRSYKPIKEFFSQHQLKQIMTRRYLRATQYIRRKDQNDEMFGFLKDYRDAGWIFPEIYDYFNGIYLFSKSLKKLEKYLNKVVHTNHPLIIFLWGLLRYKQKDYVTAAEQFEIAFVKSMKKFPEALNGLAMTRMKTDLKGAERIFMTLNATFPDYLDGKNNLKQIQNGREDNLKLTINLSPFTLDYFTRV